VDAGGSRVLGRGASHAVPRGNSPLARPRGTRWAGGSGNQVGPGGRARNVCAARAGGRRLSVSSDFTTTSCLAPRLPAGTLQIGDE
jgi:hypothetical protein